MPRENCPVCESVETELFLRRRGVPVHQNLLFATPTAARAMPRGDLEMRACSACGFVFNAAFDPALVTYGPTYENSQECSPAFNAHLDRLANHIVTDRGVCAGRIVEVGCGKGAFLRKLLTHPANRCDAIGFDPAYLGPPEALGGRVRFVPNFYGPATAVPADAVVCRHVIEHIPDPVALLRTVRAGVGTSGGTRVFFETPCVEWILRHRVTWDFFYEHCSLFTADSLAWALWRAGFGVVRVRHVFHGQYLWAEGISEQGRAPARRPVGARAAAFSAHDRDRVVGWYALLERHCKRGPVFAWGAGAKGVTFCNLADPEAQRLAGVVDVNPAKQGRFLPGTGHPIVAPEAAAGAAAVLVFNPNYVAEISASVTRPESTTLVVNMMLDTPTVGDPPTADDHKEATHAADHRHRFTDGHGTDGHRAA